VPLCVGSIEKLKGGSRYAASRSVKLPDYSGAETYIEYGAGAGLNRCACWQITGADGINYKFFIVCEAEVINYGKSHFDPRPE